jgi:hypothetical protein
MPRERRVQSAGLDSAVGNDATRTPAGRRSANDRPSNSSAYIRTSLSYRVAQLALLPLLANDSSALFIERTDAAVPVSVTRLETI